MKILAIDSSGLAASVAVISDGILAGEFTVHYKKTHSQTLLPMLDQMAKMIELDLGTLDAVAVAGGPGSFTGLRIGAAAAKGLALALGLPILHIPTVDALAYNLCGHGDIICPLMDARRDQVYTGLYRFCGSRMEILKKQCAAGIYDIIDEINKTGQPVVFLGDGAFVYRQAVGEKTLVPYTFAPPHISRQRAGAVAALACEYLKEGKAVSADDFKPEYLRLSQAEREKMERENKAGHGEEICQ